MRYRIRGACRIASSNEGTIWQESYSASSRMLPSHYFRLKLKLDIVGMFQGHKPYKSHSYYLLHQSVEECTTNRWHPAHRRQSPHFLPPRLVALKWSPHRQQQEGRGSRTSRSKPINRNMLTSDRVWYRSYEVVDGNWNPTDNEIIRSEKEVEDENNSGKF